MSKCLTRALRKLENTFLSGALDRGLVQVGLMCKLACSNLPQQSLLLWWHHIYSISLVSLDAHRLIVSQLNLSQKK